MTFDSGLAGFSPVVLLSKAEVEELQRRNQELLAANNREVEARRRLQRQVNSLFSYMVTLRMLVTGYQHWVPEKFVPLLLSEIASALEKHDKIKEEG